MALISLDLHLYHIILKVKVLGGFWAGFYELLGWKSSIQSGNTAHMRISSTEGYPVRLAHVFPSTKPALSSLMVFFPP